MKKINKMKKIILFYMPLFVLLASCKTIETTDKSTDNLSLNANKSASIENNLTFENSMMGLNEEQKNFVRENIVTTKERFSNVDFDNLNQTAKYMLYVYPNPTYNYVTVKFGRGVRVDNDVNWLSDAEIPTSISLDLYYMGTKIKTLEFSNVRSGMVEILSSHLQKEGEYTVTITGTDISDSFVVIKK